MAGVRWEPGDRNNRVRDHVSNGRKGDDEQVKSSTAALQQLVNAAVET